MSGGRAALKKSTGADFPVFLNLIGPAAAEKAQGSWLGTPIPTYFARGGRGASTAAGRHTGAERQTDCAGARTIQCRDGQSSWGGRRLFRVEQGKGRGAGPQRYI